MVVAVLATGVALGGCAKVAASSEAGEKAATLEEVKGTDLHRVTVTEKAAQRLDIQMVAVTQEEVAAGATPVTVIPYAAVVYDANGDTWAYTSPKPLTFVRSSITVAEIDGERALLSAGPVAGTEVVTVGTAELFGTEQEIGA